ncbi:hypothetical protein [Mycobacterium sp. SP-6446]|uniref:hypothetical protein n=1 Tax=Mycobacterium sp. SP-6446 TaxID=1834162 RepID=UPI00158B2549|nr:hypothetical protein [Mycobacterium sp. SP-6446]
MTSDAARERLGVSIGLNRALVYRMLAHLEADATTSKQFDGLVEVIMRGLHRVVCCDR